MTLTGTLGADWLHKHGVKETVTDETLRAWRDYLESMLRAELQLEADFAIGTRTQFLFSTPSDSHTIIEIEAFTRRALDAFLDKQTRK